jgi:hypothetical protein
MGKGSQRLLLPSAKLDPSKKSPRKLSTFFSSREGSVGDGYMIWFLNRLGQGLGYKYGKLTWVNPNLLKTCANWPCSCSPKFFLNIFNKLVRGTMPDMLSYAFALVLSIHDYLGQFAQLVTWISDRFIASPAGLITFLLCQWLLQ